MATGDINDFILRMKAVLPNGWFPSESNTTQAPVLTALLNGPAWAQSWLYSLIAYAKDQTRISSATDVWLDIIALDYFGNNQTRSADTSDIAFPSRRPGETDSVFRQRILRNLLLPKATRGSMIAAITALTGTAPKVFEPGYAYDTGGYGENYNKTWTGLAYNYAGGYGSLVLPFQAFITVYRPLTQGIPLVGGYYGAGYHVGAGGYNVGAIEYVDQDMISAQISDSDIYALVDDVAPVATIMWTAITNA